MNEDAKKTLLRMIPHGLYVVTSGKAAGDGPAHGFTATWLTQASFKPPLVMMGVRKDSQSYASVTGNGAFVVNFITKGDRAMAERFFQAPPASGSRFGDQPFRPSPATGAPVLEAALGFVECKVVHVFDHGDHSVVVGEVIEAQILQGGEPLLLSDTPWKYGG